LNQPYENYKNESQSFAAVGIGFIAAAFLGVIINQHIH